MQYSKTLIFFISIYFTVAIPVTADEHLSTTENALNIISNFANRICYDIQQKGGELRWELEGGAEAELKGLISKLIDLKIEGAARYGKLEHEGVLQKDLANALKSSADCKLTIFREMKDHLLKIKPKRDDFLYTYGHSERVKYIEQSVKEATTATKAEPLVRELMLSATIIGAFTHDVARYGEDYKSYRSPILVVDTEKLQMQATPSAEYNEQNQIRRRVSVTTRRGEGNPWIEGPERIYIKEKGDWTLLLPVPPK